MRVALGAKELEEEMNADGCQERWLVRVVYQEAKNHWGEKGG